jgi:hypothetical protein
MLCAFECTRLFRLLRSRQRPTLDYVAAKVVVIKEAVGLDNTGHENNPEHLSSLVAEHNTVLEALSTILNELKAESEKSKEKITFLGCVDI